MRLRSTPEAILRQHVEAVSRRLAAARAGEVEGIHRARVASRRLRESLALLAAGAGARKLARAVRRLTRALGPVRELDVSLAILDELQQAEAASPATLDRLRRSIEGERRVTHARAVKQLDRWDAARRRRQAAAASRPPDDCERDGRNAPRWRGARRRAARRAEQLRDAIEHAAGRYVPRRLHEIRVALKKLRYALELVRPLQPSATRATASRRSPHAIDRQLALLRRMQDLLGRMHDCEVLIARACGVQSEAYASDPRLSADLDALVGVLETECRQLHGHYMARRTQLLDVCAHVIATAADRPGSVPLAPAASAARRLERRRPRRDDEAPAAAVASGSRRDRRARPRLAGGRRATRGRRAAD